MSYKIEVENIKCNGCAKSINSSLIKLEGVKAVEVDIENEIVFISGDESTKDQVVSQLSSMGYPEKGHNDLVSQAKSYLSCAIGKMKK